MEVVIAPILSGDEILEETQEGEYDSASCAALFYREAIDWEKSQLEVKWSATEKCFAVEFTGKGNIDLSMAELLSKRVPLRIAKASTCECGTTLELGDYTVLLSDSDFLFHAEYFCPNCKANLIAEKKGLRRVLETWFTGLKKIEIKTTGIGLERS
ncbi:hypothetical protein VSR69_42230 [Paraburkholderia phytofirmans]